MCDPASHPFPPKFDECVCVCVCVCLCVYIHSADLTDVPHGETYGFFLSTAFTDFCIYLFLNGHRNTSISRITNTLLHKKRNKLAAEVC